MGDAAASGRVRLKTALSPDGDGGELRPRHGGVCVGTHRGAALSRNWAVNTRPWLGVPSVRDEWGSFQLKC